MLRFAPLFTLLLATSPLAAEPRHVTGQREGVSYDFTEEQTPDGNLVLRGTYLNTHEPFQLTVYPHGQVEGYVGAAPVSFDVSQRARDRAVADLPADREVEFAQRTTPR